MIKDDFVIYFECEKEYEYTSVTTEWEAKKVIGWIFSGKIVEKLISSYWKRADSVTCGVLCVYRTRRIVDPPNV